MFPCYNDATTIGGLVDDVHDGAVTAGRRGRGDRRQRRFGGRLARGARRAGRSIGRGCASIHHETNGGYGKALLSGFGAAQHEWIFYTDGDAQYDASEAALLVPLADRRRSTSCRATRSGAATRGTAR